MSRQTRRNVDGDGFLETNPLQDDVSMDTAHGWSTGVPVGTHTLYNRKPGWSHSSIPCGGGVEYLHRNLANHTGLGPEDDGAREDQQQL
jgi:hypothetical protein